jgi:hypothetical protein
MGRPSSSTRSGVAILLAVFLGAPAPRVAAQASPSPSPRTTPQKSVYGTLQSVDKSRSSVVMKSDTGERLSWRFEPAVIAETSRFKLGDRMIVIYRQLTPNEKRVTALAFPGSATTPVYVNTTGARVILRSGPAVNDTCGNADAGPVSESTIPTGGMAEAMDACWCCAPSGETCTPGNRSGLGRALLVQCFK